MRGTAIVFFVLAIFLLVVFNRSVFYGDNSGPSPFIKLDFGAIFYGAQWGGFWCAVLSLILFTASGMRSHTPLVSTRNILPALSLALCISFLAFSMPEWSNFDRWKDGALGWNVYVETKLSARRERRADAALIGAFNGTWIAEGGARLEIQPGNVVLTMDGVRTEFSDTTCPEAPLIRYKLADLRDVGYHFYRAGLLSTALFKNLPDRNYPLLVYTCNGRDTAFTVLDDRLFVVLYDGTSFTFTRIGSLK
jgi:hypothetical protein